MKNYYSFLLIFTQIFLFAQQETTEKKDYGKVFGGFESNSAWYLNDPKFGANGIVQPENPVRSNSYLFVNYNYKNFTAGIQGEAYEKEALLNFNPKFNKSGLATYFLNFKNKTFDITAGYFYEQFGSGLILRTWEDRALGINNALRGIRATVKPTEYLTLTGLYGQQRTGFELAEGKILGFNTDVNLSDAFKFETFDWSFGASYISRNEAISLENPNFDPTTHAFSHRMNFSYESFYANYEFVSKSRDAFVTTDPFIDNYFVKVGNAVLVNMGYTKNSLGIDLTMRRIQNMGFFSERLPDVYPNTPAGPATSYNFNDKTINFVPGLTKQHHYNLANIYVYQAQNRVEFKENDVMKAGEIGGQIDVFYNFKKGTKLGGKYGTKLAVNLANWNNLAGNYTSSPRNYETDNIEFGQKYFSDYNFEITKKVSEKLHVGFTYINQYYNRQYIEDKPDQITANIIGAEATYTFGKNKSLRFVAEHLFTQDDRKNWAGGTIEYNFANKYSIYIWDIFNYGNKVKQAQTNYYNIGGSYRINSTRIAMNYGRQRGGLVCVGGVCRFVPESTGLSLSLNTSF
jgi:hypothetical protein